MKSANPEERPTLPAIELQQALADSTGHRNMLHLIQLRWMAVVGQIATIATATLVLDIPLPVLHMVEVLVCLIAFNLASHLRWHERARVSNRELWLAMVVDVLALTLQLYLSGGTTNPFVFLYLLQITLCAMLLEAWSTWAMVGLTTACVLGLALLSPPLKLPLDHDRGLASHYVQGLLLCFVLNASLVVALMTRIQSNLRQRDARLADLRQQAAEQEHIIRMGLLASGAAHELGTPLSTLAVILGDWRRMPQFLQEPDLLEELDEMQRELARCKRIVTGILMSAGEARGEGAQRSTLATFIQQLSQDWRHARNPSEFDLDIHLHCDLPLAADDTFRQMICNVLDNAHEASPHWVGLSVHTDERTLELTISDRGPGFSPEILAQIGKPYQSTKGREGGGLGLFLVFNVALTLGGKVTATNGPEGGAVVNISLPLKSITLNDN
jgi:two-component system sensor histidine kinase RegB